MPMENQGKIENEYSPLKEKGYMSRVLTRGFSPETTLEYTPLTGRILAKFPYWPLLFLTAPVHIDKIRAEPLFFCGNRRRRGKPGPFSGPALEEYSALCEEMAAQESRRKELREAMQAASRAEATVETLLDSLKNAKGWSTWDAVGGGLETDFIKYRKMENAQSIADTLSSQLSALRDELSDLDNAGELEIRVEGFVRFADWFFDDFISAWCVRSKICDSIDQAEAVKYRLEQLNRRLQESFDDSQKRTGTLQRECDAAVREFISQQEQAG